MQSHRRFFPGSAAALCLCLLTVVGLTACASVPASRVRIVPENQAARISPLESCGYVGKVTTAIDGYGEQALQELREKAGRRGGNTLVVSSGAGPLHGTAYLCQAPLPDRSNFQVAWGSGADSGGYGPAVAQVHRPTGTTDEPANPRH